MEQEDFIGCRYPGIKPGWKIDPESGRMTEKNAVVKKCPPEVTCISLRHDALMDLAFGKKTSCEYIWKNDFIEADEKYCFVIRINSSYSETLEWQYFVAKGTVTEVIYKRSIAILVCSEDVNAYAACSSYIENIITGTEAGMDERIRDSCKKCFIYDRFVANDSNKSSFDSVMHCLKEASRVVEEMKTGENFHLWSGKYCKENYYNIITSSIREPLREEASFYKNKIFNDTDANYQITRNSPAQHTFGNDTGKHRVSHSNVADEARNNTVIGVHKSTLSVSPQSDCRNYDTFNTTITASQCSSETSIYEQVKDNLINSNDTITVNKANYLNLVTSESSLIDDFPNEVIKDLDSQRNDKLSILSSSTSTQIAYKDNTTYDVKESNTLTKILPEIVYSNDNEQLAHHSDPINSTINKTPSVSSISFLAVPEDGSESQSTNESINDDEKSNKTCELSDKIKVNVAKQAKGNGKKRIFVAEKLSLNGPPEIESIPSKHQLKRLKKENYIEYLNNKILLTVAEDNGIMNVEIGIKRSEIKGKVIVLLGATGCGKTSIVNLCANFYFGAQNANDKKLFIVDSKTKTDRVTVYTFHPEEDCQFPLTVVDTPGLNDSTGAEIHDHVDALKSFLALACSRGLEINAICFVAQAHLVRLTSSEKLVMDYVRSLFGSEVEEHIMALVTFSDNQPIPPVIEAMEQYGFAKPFFVKFNNTLLISKSEEVDDLDRIYWRTGIRSWKKCLKQLSLIDSLSNSAISSVKSEVFNKYVLNKYIFSLEAELCNFIAMCSKKKKVEEFYSDKELLHARYKLWMASNDAYSVDANLANKTKELFLIEACQLQLKNTTTLERSAVIKLFLLLDQESLLSCVLTNIVSTFLKCLGIFNNHLKAEGNYLTTFCNGCDKYCKYEKQHWAQSERIGKFRCNCSHSNGLHGPPSEISPHRIFRKRELYVHTSRSIRHEISKYEGLNCDVDGLWTVGQVLKNLQLSNPTNYNNKYINSIFENLNIVSNE